MLIVSVMKPEVWIEQNRIYVRGGAPRGGDGLHRTISSWPGWGRCKTRGRNPWSMFRAPLCSSACEPLLTTDLGLEWREPGDRALMQACCKGLARATALLHPNPSESHSIETWTERRPRPHQTQAVLAIEAMGYRALLGDEMGLGKSSTSLWAVGRSACTRLLIICPKSVVFNWPKEVKKTLGEKRTANFVLQGTPKRRADQFEFLRGIVTAHETMKPEERHDLYVLVMTWGILRYLSEQQRETLERWVDGEAVILDESQNMRGPKSQRTQFILNHVCPPVGGPRVRLSLTGTPIMNTVEDLWSQIQAVQPGMWTSRSDYINRYVRMGLKLVPVRKKGVKKAVMRNVRNPLGAKNLDELNHMLTHVVIRREKSEVDNLPPKIHTVIELELEGPELVIYRAMREEALLLLGAMDEDTNIFQPEAGSAVEAWLRCEQIAQGFVGGVPQELITGLGSALEKSRARGIPGRPGELMFPGSPKVLWLTETIEAIGKPVVVFSRFNAPLFWLNEHLEGARIMHGGTSAQERQDIVDLFQEGQVRVLLCNVLLGVGFTITRAQDVLFYGRDYIPGTNMQAEDRVHRIGQKGTVNVQIPVVRGTIETLIHKRLQVKKGDMQGALPKITVKELMEAI